MIIFARKHFQGAGANFFVAFLNLAIYFRASLTLLSHWARRLRFPILDAGFLFLGLFLLKNFWANYHFRDPNYYSDTILYINFPLYILIWILSIFFSGGYDQPPNIRRIIRGVLVGTILAAAVYGFLPMDLRSSRALILLATAWALFILPALRLFGNAIK